MRLETVLSVVSRWFPEAISSKVAWGTLLKRVEASGGDVAYEAYLSTDAVAIYPEAVVDKPCDPTGSNAEKSVAAVVHGTVKTRLLKTGDGQPPSGAQLAKLAEHGVFAV